MGRRDNNCKPYLFEFSSFSNSVLFSFFILFLGLILLDLSFIFEEVLCSHFKSDLKDVSTTLMVLQSKPIYRAIGKVKGKRKEKEKEKEEEKKLLPAYGSCSSIKQCTSALVETRVIAMVPECLQR